MTRQEANLEICKHLADFFSSPYTKDVRFWQALFNLDIITFQKRNDDVLQIQDDYNKESVEILKIFK